MSVSSLVLPLPIFHGVTIPPMPEMGMGSFGAAPVSSQPWGLPDSEMQKFNQMFSKIVGSTSLPVMDGSFVTIVHCYIVCLTSSSSSFSFCVCLGDTAKEMFSKSGLPPKTVTQVWYVFCSVLLFFLVLLSVLSSLSCDLIVPGFSHDVKHVHLLI